MSRLFLLDPQSLTKVGASIVNRRSRLFDEIHSIKESTEAADSRTVGRDS
jgi:hypothetical protein